MNRILLVLLIVLATVSAARADDFAAAVTSLNADNFADKIAAAEVLAATGDPRAVLLLEAMGDGRLSTASDGRVIVELDGALKDAATLEPAGLAAADLTQITVNNRLRGVLRGAVGRLGLFSPDPASRRRAAEAILASPTPDSAEMVRGALAKESDPGVKAVMGRALATLDLGSDQPAQRLAALVTLADSYDPNVQGLIHRLLETESDAEIRRVAEKALSAFETRLVVVNFAANLFQGLSLGSVLLLAAIGLAVTFGVMGVINMAHGEMIMLGAYAAYAVQQGFRTFLPASVIDLYLVAAVPVAFLFTALVGMALERGVIRFLYGRPLETMLATWGISLILQQAVRQVFGATNMEVANPAWMTGGLDLAGGFTLTFNRVVIIGFCLTVLGGLAALLRWSSFGLHMRAVTQNRPMASAMGIPTGRVDALTFGLGSGIAGIAGVALSQIGNVSPNLGQGYIVDSFMVVVFGGVGSLWGTLVGAVSLGLINKLLEPYAGAMLGKILVLVFIILFIQKRPRGLFALKGRSVES